MLSRSVRRATGITTYQLPVQNSAQSEPARRFSRAVLRQQCRASSTREEANGSRQYNGKQEQPLRSSVRPFTILFLCIPLGYAVNWALKKQNAAAQQSPDGFVKYLLASKDDVSPTCSIFSLLPSHPNAAIDVHAPELARSITSVQIKQPQLQIARSYTLLPSVKGQDDDELRFLIKKEQRGEVSGYIHRLPLDAEIEIRGVSQEYVVPNDVDKVIILAGGTGIAPAMQFADILKNKQAEIHILWANRKREDCAGGVSDNRHEDSAAPWWSMSRLWSSSAPSEAHENEDTTRAIRQKHQVVRELDAAKATVGSSEKHLQVDYFVDEEGQFIRPRDVQGLLRASSAGRKLLIVSGPEGFINYWAGPKQWLNGREVQGPIAGALGGMNTTGCEIVKL